MFAVESYAAVRRFVFVEGRSQREAARVFGLSRETVAKMCRFSLPPGYTRNEPAAKPKLGPLLPMIDAILEADRTAPVKQRHTAKRIFERLRDEHGFAGGYTVVKDYVRISRARGRETFVPLAHPPGHAQVDFGEAIGVIGGVRRLGARDRGSRGARRGVRLLWRRAAVDPLRQSMDASRRKVNVADRRRGMHKSIRPVTGAVVPLALMGVRCLRPHNMIGRMGLVVDQASKLRSLPTNHQDHLAFGRARWMQAVAAASQGAAYASFRFSNTQAIRAVLLASATIVRLKPRRATSAFSQFVCRSSCLDRRPTTARAPWISCRLR